MLNRLIPEGWRRLATKPTATQDAAPADAQIEQQLLSEDVTLRRAALARSDDLQALQRLMEQDHDAGVRDCAQARLCKLIEGHEDVPLLSIEARQHALQAILTPVVAERIAVKAAEPLLRIDALQGVDREDFCAERAVVDPVAKVREAALQRVHDPQSLTVIARRTRKSDKHISRSAKLRAQALLEDQQRLQDIEAICTEVEQLPWDGETGPNAARFAQLEQRWQGVVAQASPQQQQRFQTAQEQFQAHLRASATQRQQRLQLCQQADALLEHLQATEQPPAERATTQDLIAQWQALEPADDPESRRLQRRFEEQCTLLLAREHQLSEHQQQQERLRQVCAQGEQLLSHSGRLVGAAVQRFSRDGQAVLESGAPQGEPATQFAQIHTALQRRLAEQDVAQPREQAALKATLDALEQALDDGELQQAISLQQQAQQQLAANIGLTQRQIRDFRQRLNSTTPRLAQLRDWRRWGTNRSRESLIEAVEQLIGSDFPPEELIQQVQQARQHWKTMDKTGVHAPRALWKQFDQACERAYEPVRAWRAEQAAERQKNWQTRVALCEQLEQQVEIVEAQADTPPDWRAVSRFEQRVRQQWQQAGPVDRRQHKVVERRYLAAMKRLQAKLQPVLDQDLARRRDLIDQAEALAQSTDHERAVDTVKRLQSLWQPQVLASRRQEQVLWKRFRAACDAVFERRQAQQAAQREQHQHRRQRQEQVLTALHSLIERIDQLSDTDAEKQFAALQDEWAALNPGSAERGHERRFAQASQRFATMQRASARRSELEAVLQTQPPPEAVDSPELLAAQQHRCLQLEVLLGLDSPPEFAEVRLQFRVAQLSEALGEREQDTTAHWEQVMARLREACADAWPADPALTERWQRIVDALRTQAEDDSL